MRIKRRLNPRRGADAAFWDLDRDGVTQSMLGRWLTCPERGRLDIKHGLEPLGQKASLPLDFGTAVHDLLEQQYRESKFGPKVLDRFISEYEDDWMGAVAQQVTADVAHVQLVMGLAAATLPGYFDHWRHEWGNVKWVGLEHEFNEQFPLPDGASVRVRGKLDGAYEDRKGNLFLFETKTKGQIDSGAITSTLGLDLQVNLYAWALEQQLKEPVRGVRYNVIRRPGLRQKKNEDLPEFLERVKDDVQARPDHYFMRFEVSLDDEDTLRWRESFAQMLMQFRSWAEGKWNYLDTTQCMGRFGLCPFVALCHRGDHKLYRRRDAVFPELSPGG